MTVAVSAGVVLEHTSGALSVSISVSRLQEVFPDDVADEARSAGEALAFVYDDLPGRASESSAMVTTAACFAMTMSSSIACTSKSGSAQQSRTTTKR
jgi:hypothetical protein